MPLVYNVPVQVFIPPVIDPANLAGEDVSLRGGDLTVTSAGDWGVVTGPLAARQSVEREAIASPGDMPRRPEWGMGLRNSLMRGTTRDERDRQASAVRRRLNANPRIDSIQTVDVSLRDDLPVQGAVTVTIAAFAAGEPLQFQTQVIPKNGR